MFRQQFMLMHIVKRYGHGKTHWVIIIFIFCGEQILESMTILFQSVKAKLKTTSQKAMQHFDDFYGSVYNERWRSIRAALLTEHKYTAVINFFGDVEKTKLQMECDGAINIRHLYQAMQNEDLNPKLNSGRMKYLLNSGPQGQTALEKSMQDFVHKQRSSEIQSMYEQNVEDGLEKFGTATETDVETENSRAKEPLEMAKFNKSLEEMVQKSGLDLNRMIEPEVGTAGLQEFVPATKLKGMEDFLPESHHYKYYSTTVDFPLKTELEANFTFPEHLEVYTFEHGNVTRFRRPSSSETGAFTHFLMDGASLLPPLLLDVQPGEVVLDACAAPGGKSLVLLQTLRPKQLVCNEMYDSRLKRIKNLMKQYVPDFDKQWKEDRCVIRRGDASYLDEYDHYDRVSQNQKSIPIVSRKI